MDEDGFCQHLTRAAANQMEKVAKSAFLWDIDLKYLNDDGLLVILLPSMRFQTYQDNGQMIMKGCV